MYAVDKIGGRGKYTVIQDRSIRFYTFAVDKADKYSQLIKQAEKIHISNVDKTDLRCL